MAAVAAMNPYHRSFELPAGSHSEQERRFRKLLGRSLLGVLVLGLIMPWLPVPQRAADAIDEMPPRLARFVLEREPVAPPPPPVVQERIIVPEVVPERAREQRRPEPVPRPQPQPQVQPPDTRVAEARERAANAGVMPMLDQLAALRESAALNNVLGADTVVSSQAARAERAMITSRSGQSSGGINTAELSRGTGGDGLAGRSATTVASPVAGLVMEESVSRAGRTDGVASRSREEIEMVFDQQKGAIYALYSRALRADPSLQGKMVLRLTIAPDGTVTACDVVSSELNDAELERRLVQRVMMFRFQERNVMPVTYDKPIEFFPA
jgi:protein TonB